MPEERRGPRSRDGTARGKGRGPRDDRRTGRDSRDSRPERQLYATEVVVDHGFQDVAEGENEAESRRVDWTIIKRTTVDRQSARSISAAYVLRRDGSDTEFPSLGAAREAVQKTIRHPEKLTRSKADHAAAKK